MVKKARWLFICYAFMFFAPSIAFATNLEFNHTTYSKIDAGLKEMYEVATKGLEEVLVGSDEQVVFDYSLIGLSKKDVISRLGKPHDQTEHYFTYFVKTDRISQFKIVILKFTESGHVKFVHFPVLHKSSFISVNRESIQRIFGEAQTKKMTKMIYTSNNPNKKVTFTWTGLLNKKCIGIYLGEFKESDDLLMTMMLDEKASDTYDKLDRGRFTKKTVQKIKELEDQWQEQHDRKAE